MELFLWTSLGAFLLGTIEAIFGAIKDTLWEGFSWFTFFRSPFIIVVIAITLFGPMRVWGGWDVLTVVLAAGGLERFLTETYKVFVGKKPSKFLFPDRDRGWVYKRLEKFRRGRVKEVS